MISTFDYQPRTRTLFGNNAFERIGELARELGFQRTLLVADPGIRAQGFVERAVRLLQEQEILITDGPYHFMAGTVEAGELRQVKHFELCCGRHILGTLPLAPVPTAAFTQEGGFVAPDAFEWSPTAEEQLRERLGKLLGQ